MNSIKVKLGKLVWHRGCIADVSWKLYIKQQLTENSWSAKMLLHWSVQLRPLANHPSLDRPTSALEIACRFTKYTGWAKKVIPLVHILHCTRGITFFGPPGTCTHNL